MQVEGHCPAFQPRACAHVAVDGHGADPEHPDSMKSWSWSMCSEPGGLERSTTWNAPYGEVANTSMDERETTPTDSPLERVLQTLCELSSEKTCLGPSGSSGDPSTAS